MYINIVIPFIYSDLAMLRPVASPMDRILESSPSGFMACI